jgi:hypothetical protein|tara:strand:+ start:1017 stop:1187 length:171 start_codon:yes stop_codon:yes gene_type:complete
MNTQLYSQYCRVNDAVFELVSSIAELGAKDIDVNLTLSDIEDTVYKKLKEIEDAEE